MYIFMRYRGIMTSLEITLLASSTIKYVQIYGYCAVLTIKVSLISLFVLGTGTEISPPCIRIIFRVAAGFSELLEYG